MLDVFNTSSPQSANYQEFYSGGPFGFSKTFTWAKPRGASMVRMLLIGGGGGGRPGTTGAGGAGGGSGVVTTWIGPAMFIPDILLISVGIGGGSNGNGGPTYVQYVTKASTPYTLLSASGGTGSGGIAGSNNFFGASGIFGTVAGQNGAAAGTAIAASATTFLSGGAGGGGGVAGSNVAAHYGYPTVIGGPVATGNIGGAGYFMTQPFMQGTGGGGGGSATGTGGTGGVGGVGCGGGGGGRGTTAGGAGGAGGGGAAFIWAW